MRDYSLNPHKFLNDEELAHLESLLHRLADREPRNTLMFFLLLNTGVRPSELLDVRVKDVNWFGQDIFFRGIKGSRDRTIPIQPWLFTKLKTYVFSDIPPQADERIFPISYVTLGKIWRDYRPVKKELRSTRHTFAVKVYRKTNNVRLVQKLLGHKWVSTTEIYLDFEYSSREFREALL